METLIHLPEDCHTVICSIHNSRGSVYAKFIDIVLLARALIYVGLANNEVLAYFLKFLFVICSIPKITSIIIYDLIA